MILGEKMDKREESDFLKLGQILMHPGDSGRPLYIEQAEQIESYGKKRVIKDRESNEPYLERYYFMNYRPFARIVLHKFVRSDVDGLHDHPWPFETYILSGGYWEHNKSGKHWRPPGYHGRATANYFHRVELDPEKAGEDTWTLFMMGKKEKDWGFLDENDTWVQWETYLSKKKEKVSNE